MNLYSYINKQIKTGLKGGMEEVLAAIILKNFASERLDVIQNVYIPLANGNTAEADLVIVHSTGIYSIECKNYSGWIFGNEFDNMWTQSFSSGKKYRFYNPVAQNKYHIQALSRYLSIPIEYFKSYIVFGEQCSLKKVPQNTDLFSIMQLYSLPKNINRDITERQIIFSDSVVEKYTAKITELKDTTGQKRKAHDEQVKKAHPDNEPQTPKIFIKF